MPELWDIQSILFWIGVVSSVLFVIKMGLFILLGGDVELDADFTAITEADTAFTFLSIQSLLAFFMGFGWCGYVAQKQFALSDILTLGVAILFGLFFMWFSAYLTFSIKKLEKKIKIDLNELVGKAGKAYTAFEPQGEGKIEIILNDKLTILEAKSVSDEKIDSFSIIKVEKVEDKKIFIIKV